MSAAAADPRRDDDRILHPVDLLHAGKPAVVRLEWHSTYKADKPGPVHAQFWLDGSAKFTDQGVRSQSARVRFDGRPAPVAVGNVKLTLLGFEPDGAIRVRIDSVAAGQRVAFDFTPAPRIVIIGY